MIGDKLLQMIPFQLNFFSFQYQSRALENCASGATILFGCSSSYNIILGRKSYWFLVFDCIPLTFWYVWVTWLNVKVLIAISGLHIQGVLNFAIKQFDKEIKELDTCFTKLISKLDIRIKVIKFYHKIFKTILLKLSSL